MERLMACTHVSSCSTTSHDDERESIRALEAKLASHRRTHERRVMQGGRVEGTTNPV